MDDLTLIRSFRAERADGDPRARAAAWRALEARFDPASTTSSMTPIRPPRRGLLALAGTGAIAATVAGILALGSGSTAEPAAAEALHQAATVAAEADIAPRAPGPGELLYAKRRDLGLWSWDSSGKFVGLSAGLSRPDAFTALVSTDVETWTSADGTDRVRETLGPIRFLSDSERTRWEEAGLPLPGKFDPSAKDVHAKAFGHILRSGGRLLELRRGVVDLELAPQGGRGHMAIELPDPSNLPEEPEALRRAVQSGEFSTTFEISEGADGQLHATPQALDTVGTIFGIWTILSRSAIAETPAAVRAAAFEALAEMPDIELERGATDLVGRTGDTIRYRGEKSWLVHEFVFDPTTSQALGERSVLANPKRGFANANLPAGTVISEVAYLQSKVIDSTREPKGKDKNTEPIATTSPVYRK